MNASPIRRYGLLMLACALFVSFGAQDANAAASRKAKVFGILVKP